MNFPTCFDGDEWTQKSVVFFQYGFVPKYAILKPDARRSTFLTCDKVLEKSSVNQRRLNSTAPRSPSADDIME